MQTKSRAIAAVAPNSRAEVLTAAVVALVAGMMLVATVGFAHPELLHNAAHDWRHSMSFPCH
jgi:cobalt transporter subunit CbtB